MNEEYYTLYVSEKYSALVAECVQIRERQVRKQAEALTQRGVPDSLQAQFLGVNERFLDRVTQP